jgi:hypothetical protein
VFDPEYIELAIESALKGEQIQPILLWI